MQAVTINGVSVKIGGDVQFRVGSGRSRRIREQRGIAVRCELLPVGIGEQHGVAVGAAINPC